MRVYFYLIIDQTIVIAIKVIFGHVQYDKYYTISIVSLDLSLKDIVFCMPKGSKDTATYNFP